MVKTGVWGSFNTLCHVLTLSLCQIQVTGLTRVCTPTEHCWFEKKSISAEAYPSIQRLVNLIFSSLLSHCYHSLLLMQTLPPPLFPPPPLPLLLPFPLLPALLHTLLITLPCLLDAASTKETAFELKDYIKGGMVYMGSGRSHPPHIHMLSHLAYLVSGSCWQTEGKMCQCSMLADVHQLKKIQMLLFQKKSAYTQSE